MANRCRMGRTERTRGVSLATRAGVLGLAFAVGGPATAGPLAPPAGPVSNTNAGIEFTQAKTVIDSLPFTIAAPGSYIISEDLTGASGIDVIVGDVSIDLNGFTLRGNGTGTDAGIEVAAGLSNIVIQRGTIELWGGDGISAGAASSGVISQMTIAENGGDGVSVGDEWAIVDCTVRDNTGRGIGGGNNGIVEGSLIEGNQAEGMEVGDGWNIEGSTAADNIACGFRAGRGTTIVNSTARGNTGAGFGLDINSAISQSVADDNSTGFELGSGSMAHQCTARGGGQGFDALNGGVQIISCSAFDVDGPGMIVAGSVVRDALVVGGSGEGIRASDGSLIERCVAHQTSLGILVTGSGTSVRGCTLTGNNVGMQLAGSNNLAEGNTASGNLTLDYDFLPGNAWGFVKDVAGDGAFQEPTSFVNLRY